MKLACANYIFESELKKIKVILPDVLTYVNAQFPYISEDDLFELRVVYSELLINAIIHGNRRDTSKKVKLTVIPRAYEVVSTVTDEGRGFDYLRILNCSKYSEHPMSEYGKGLRLVKALTERLSFNNLGNEIEFRKKIMYNCSAESFEEPPVLRDAANYLR